MMAGMTAKVTLSFSDETIDEARRSARREGVSLSAWMDRAARERALREVFAAHAAAVRRAASTARPPPWPTSARWHWSTRSCSAIVLRRGEIWRIEGARERLGLVISSDVYNGTDVPIVVVVEVVPEDLLRDSPLAVPMSGYVVMPDRLSSPLKKWFTERLDVADTETMQRVSRALRIIQDV
jgi:mRNA interferase MazF